MELLLLLSIFYFINTNNLLSIGYLAGILLFCLGLITLIQDGDIFVGFLGIVDLGVGLVFLLFILHFSLLLKHKMTALTTIKTLFGVPIAIMFIANYFTVCAVPSSHNDFSRQYFTNFFFVSGYDFYDLLTLTTVTDLTFIKEIYFINNSGEFIMMNFLLLYGIMTTILLSFLVQKTFNFLTSSFSVNTPNESSIKATFFIRTQNNSLQHQMSTGVRIGQKTPNLSKK